MARSRSLPVAIAALIVPLALGAQGGVPLHRDIAVSGAFRPVVVRSALQIATSSAGAGRITALSVSPTGDIVVADGSDRLFVFGPAGDFHRAIGGYGDRIGEFAGPLSLGWLHDTLAVLDQRSRAISLFSIASGAAESVLQWPHALAAAGSLDGPIGLLNGGDRLFVVLQRRGGAPRPSPLVDDGWHEPAPRNTLVPVTGAGVGLPMLQPFDSAETVLGMDCVDRQGNIQILGGFFPDHGSIRAVTPAGQLITASRDSFVLTVRQTDSPIPSATIDGPQMRVLLTGETWDSVAADYRDADRAHGLVKCDPPATRPLFVPAVRAIAADDAGRLWVEIANRDGTAMDVLLPDGTALVTFHMPPHESTVPWHVWNSRLYVAVAGPGGAESVEVFRVNP